MKRSGKSSSLTDIVESFRAERSYEDCPEGNPAESDHVYCCCPVRRYSNPFGSSKWFCGCATVWTFLLMTDGRPLGQWRRSRIPRWIPVPTVPFELPTFLE